MVEPGECELESWAERARGGARTLLHAGVSCRVGAVELGVGADRVRIPGSPGVTGLSPQLKWAAAIDAEWSAGVVLSGQWQTSAPAAYQGSTVIIPLTWQPRDDLAFHLNAGRDFRRHEPDSARGGASVEWMPLARWSFVAERFRESGVNAWRLGARWLMGDRWTLDVSRASGMAGGEPPWWTLGIMYSLAR
jgi:hypothetical protein